MLFGGRDAAALPLAAFRRDVGVVFQAPSLLNGSFHDNIDFGSGLGRGLLGKGRRKKRQERSQREYYW